MKDVKLIKPMYSCQEIPAVVFGQKCSTPCLYCGLSTINFSEEKIIASGKNEVLQALQNYKSAYFSPTTDCFLNNNAKLTHYLLEEIWKRKPKFTPLVITKQIIPEETIRLFIANKENLVLQISVPVVDEKIVSILEPGSAKISERLKMIKKLTSAKVPVIAVAMPWFPLDEFHEDLPIALSEAGIKKAIIATGVLAETQRKKMIRSGNKKIKFAAKWTKMNDKDGATKKGHTYEIDIRLVFLRKLVDLFNLHGIKVMICTSDNYDLIGKTSLPLCQKFKHHNFD